jgi:hypothetical protein
LENNKNYVVLYNPKAEEKARHKCDLPTISGNSGGEFEYRAVIECEQCAKKWYAIVWNHEDYDRKNEWKPVKWYHMRLHYFVATRKGRNA